MSWLIRRGRGEPGEGGVGEESARGAFHRAVAVRLSPRPLSSRSRAKETNPSTHRPRRRRVLLFRRQRRGRAALIIIQPQRGKARGRRAGLRIFLHLFLIIPPLQRPGKVRFRRGSSHRASSRGIRPVGRITAVRVGVEQGKCGRRRCTTASARPAPLFGRRFFRGWARGGGGGIAVVVLTASRRRRRQGIDDLVVIRAPPGRGLALLAAGLLFGSHLPGARRACGACVRVRWVGYASVRVCGVVCARVRVRSVRAAKLRRKSEH